MTDEERQRPKADVGPESRAPSSRGARLEEAAAAVDRVAAGRVSALLFIGILGLPLGCAFIVGFVALVLVIGGALVLIGLEHSAVANEVALFVALAGAFAFVVVVYRKLIPRIPWLRRLINR